MTRNRTMWGAVTTVTVLAAAALATGPAQAAAPAAATSAAGDDVTKVAERLGDARTAGTWLDGGKTVVAVTDAEAAKSVTAAGGVARLVARSTAGLTQAKTSLDSSLRAVPGTAWGVDPRTNQVVVSYDSRVKGAQLSSVKAAVAKLGSGARLTAAPGTFRKFVSGGEAIWTSGGRCSLGFNVTDGSSYYFVTAGHCTNIGSSWSATNGGPAFGSTAGSSFPGNDYGIVRYTDGSTPPGNVYLYNGGYQDIASAATPQVGQSVTRSGSTTGLHSGSVTALNQTVNYGGGDIVSGLIQTTVCAEPGDSGGSLFGGSTAYGLTSGGSGDCSSGGTTFFQPVVEALNAYGVSVY